MVIARRLALTTALASFTVLGGCALPASVSIASWVIDGVSYLATEKSLTDHGISMVMGEDCALHRIVTDNFNVCYPEIDSVTTVAEADSGSGGIVATDAVSALTTSDALVEASAFQLATTDGAGAEDDASRLLGAEDLAAFETASGDAEALMDTPAPAGGLFASDSSLPVGALDGADQLISDLDAIETTSMTVADAFAATPNASPVVFAMTSRVPVQEIAARMPQRDIAAAIMADAQAPVAALAAARNETAALATSKTQTAQVPVRSEAASARGSYVVVGSFRDEVNARRMAERHADLSAHVIEAHGLLYRVVVGPVPRAGEARTTRLLAEAGLTDVWTLSVGGNGPVEVAALE